MPSPRTQQAAPIHVNAAMPLGGPGDDALADRGLPGTTVLLWQHVLAGGRVRLDMSGRVGRCSAAGS
jgi:hypothetical protein